MATKCQWEIRQKEEQKICVGGHIIGRVTVLLNMVELTEMNQVFGENNKWKEKFKKMPWEKWKWKQCSKLMGYSESSPRREIHSDTCLLQETNKKSQTI